MVLNNINKNDSILLEVLASVFTVSSNFTDNPRITDISLTVTLKSNQFISPNLNLQKIQNRDFFSVGYTILKLEKINQIGHAGVSGIEPSSVIFGQTVV